jgi:hypothetical protein
MGAYMREIAEAYKSEVDPVVAKLKSSGIEGPEASNNLAELQWIALAKAVPQLGFIMSKDSSRQLFFSQFEVATGVDLSKEPFWRNRANCPSGLEFVKAFQQDQLGGLLRGSAKEKLSPLDDLIGSMINPD